MGVGRSEFATGWAEKAKSGLMDELQRLVDRLRAVLTGEVVPQPGDVEALNAELLAAVAMANDRLKRCESLLQQGYRSEAIQQCEIAPNLLDVVAVLDFAESNEWANLMREHGLDVPAELRLEAAADLNEAYLLAEPLESLMQQHRLLALGRGSLDRRLAVMRQIRRKDPENPLWEQDVRLFERERLGEIRSALRAASQSANADHLGAMERELKSDAWLERPSPRLVSEVVRAHNRSRALVARRELEQVEPALTSAFAELDVAAARMWRDRFCALQQIAELPPDDPLIEQVAPAMEWLEQCDASELAEQQHQQAVADLDNAITTSQPREVIERLYNATTLHDYEIPAALQRRCHDYLQYVEVRGRRRFVAVMTGSIIAVVAVGALVGLMILQRGRETDITTHSANLASLIEDSKLAEAGDYLAGLTDRDWLFQDSRIQQLAAQLKSSQQAEEDRQRQVLVLEQTIRELVEQKSPTWAAAEEARTTLGQMEKLATSVEQARIEQARLSITRVENRLQNQVNDDFDRDLAEFVDRVQDVPDDDIEAIDALRQQLRELNERPRVSQERKTGSLPGIDARLVALKIEAQRNIDVREALADITDQVGNVDRFQAALESYAKKFPDTSRSQDLQKVAAEEAGLWKHVATWNTLKEGWAHRDFGTISPEDARKLLDQLDEAGRATSPLPVPPVFRRLRDTLAAVAQRESQGRNGPTDNLMTVLRDPAVANLMMIHTSNGEYIYVKEEPRTLGKKLLFKRYTTMTLTKTIPGSVVEAEVDNLRKNDSTDWQAPQSRFAAFASDRLRFIATAGWEAVYLDLLAELHAASQMDPIVRILLMKHVLNAASQGSTVIRSAFEAEQRTLAGVQVDPSINWFDPESRSAIELRERLSAVLEGIKPPAEKRMMIQEQLESLSKPAMGPRYTWTGWLSRNSNGSCVMRVGPREELHGEGELFVLNVQPSSVPDQPPLVSFVHVGKLEDGRPTLAENPAPPADSPWREGRAVFLTRSAGKAAAVSGSTPKPAVAHRQ